MDDPFLLHPSSPAYLAGDPAGIRQRFASRRDALDLLALFGIAAGVLLFLVNLVQIWRGSDSEETGAALSTLAIAGLLIAGGAVYLNGRRSAAAARVRLIREGTVLPGTLTACTARHESTAELAFGDVTRSYLVAVDYRFTAPAGHEVTGYDENGRPDLRHAELPEAGAPVRVLYLDDQNYALL